MNSERPLPTLPSPPEGVVEQHVHLGGAVPIHRLFEAAVDRGIRLPVSSYEEFQNLLHRRPDNSGSLDAYLEVYEVAERIQSGPRAVRESVLVALNGAFRTQGSLQVGIDGEILPSQSKGIKIRALELRFNPMKRNSGGIWDLDRVMLAACSAVNEIKTAYRGKMEAGLIVCFGRDLPWKQNEILAEKVSNWVQGGLPIVGIDLAGPESHLDLSSDSSRKRLARLFSRAGSKIGRTAHCGETRAVDLPTFLYTVEALSLHRVGHPLTPLRAYLNDGDDSGLRFLAEKKIVCELCVASNLLTRAVSCLDDYRTILQALDEYDIPYTFSTDAPALQKTTLASELFALLEAGAATAEQLRRSFEVSAASSFLDLKDYNESSAQTTA